MGVGGKKPTFQNTAAGGTGEGACMKPNPFARLSNEENTKSNHLHNVEHVVQTTFQSI